eukprot:9381037-Lingulodinium_polyedra.AAC.1
MSTQEKPANRPRTRESVYFTDAVMYGFASEQREPHREPRTVPKPPTARVSQRERVGFMD